MIWIVHIKKLFNFNLLLLDVVSKSPFTMWTLDAKLRTYSSLDLEHTLPVHNTYVALALL